MGEIVPIDNDQAREKRPFNIRVTPDAFSEPLRILMEWNPVVERWSFEVRQINVDERIIKNLVTPYFPYWYRPYLLFTFLDTSGNETEVTPENLGDEIQLYIYPGPAGQETI